MKGKITMKKILAILLVFTLMLSLTFTLISCDNTPDNGGNNTDNGGNEGNNGNNNGNNGNDNGGNDNEPDLPPVTEGPIIPWPMD